MDFTLLLASSVVAAVVAGIISFIQSERSNSLKHITGNRADWRREIKEAMQALRLSFKENKSLDRKKALGRIENQLNPYGKFRDEATFCCIEKVNALSEAKKLFFFEDGHIWSSIKKFKEKRTQENLDELLDYLGLLLKYDWERSKSESKLNVHGIAAILLSCLGCWSYSQLSPSSLGTGLLIFLVPVLFPLYIAYGIPNIRSRFCKEVVQILLIAYYVVCLLFMIISYGRQLENPYGVLVIIIYSVVLVLACSALLSGKWGRDLDYLQALQRRSKRVVREPENK